MGNQHPSPALLPTAKMIKLTPGFVLLLRCLPVGLVPVTVVIALQQLGNYFAVAIPTCVLVIASITSLPIYIAARIMVRIMVDRARASSMGASLPPLVRSDSIGNVSIQRMMVHNFKHGYPGTLVSHSPLFTRAHVCCIDS